MDGIALCAGVGGLELGLRLALGEEYRCIAYVEKDVYARRILAARMRDGALDAGRVHPDIFTFDGSDYRGRVDVVTAGFPCPPVSTAGKRLGTADVRWLWPEVARVIREARPRWVFLENVRGLLSANLGRAFGDVLRDLAGLGFNAEWGVFSAAGCGATHRRERVFVLAHTHGSRSGAQHELLNASVSSGSNPDVAHAQSDLRGAPGNNGRVAPYGTGGIGTVADAEGDAGGELEPEPVGRSAAGLGGNGEKLADAALLHGDGGDGEPGRRVSEPGDGRCPLADADRRRRRPRGTEPAGQPGDSAALGSSDLALADAGILRNRESVCRSEPESPQRDAWQESGWGSGLLGNPDLPRRKGRGESVAESADQFPPWPPGPEDRRAWERVLRVRPDLAPATESPVRRMADGLARRVDRLRAAGNGVVPVVAAVAFLSLRRRLM